jgi:bifunctional DNase/RNase
MTYQFVAALVQALGGRVLKVRIDRVEEETYIATVGWKAHPAYSWWTRGPATR